MSDPSDNESPKVIFRVFAEKSGKVFLFYEPLAQRVEIEPPVTKVKLEEANHQLVELAQAAYDNEREQLEGTDELGATAQQQANRQIRKALEP